MDWSSALSGLWGGIKPYATDSNNWMGALGALGTGLGIYDIYRSHKAESDYLKSQRDWQRQLLSVANAPLNLNPDVARRVEELSSAPLDVEALFNPGKDLIMRQIEAGLAERGLQPGGAYTSAQGEGMMKNYLDAARVAQGLRDSQVNAASTRYQGDIQSQLGRRQAAISGMTGAAPARPNFGVSGDVGALGKYLATRQVAQSTDRARADQKSYQDQVLEMLRSNTGGQGFAMPPAASPYSDQVWEEDY